MATTSDGGSDLVDTLCPKAIRVSSDEKVALSTAKPLQGFYAGGEMALRRLQTLGNAAG
jgi:hypothetical protein